MQKLKFPMEYLRVTQGYGFKADGSVDTGSYSHAGTYAMDFGGKDTGSDPLYCPCDMVVKRARQNANGELYLESTLPVELADGTCDYVHLLFLHDNKFNVVEGQVLTQGYHFYDEGGMGSGNAHAFGTHVHIEGGKGKWKSTTQAKNAQGVYASENMYPLHKMFILGDDVQILDDGGYDWKRTSDMDKPDDKIYGVDVNSHRSDSIVQKIIAGGKAQFIIMRATIGSEKEDGKLAKFIKDVADKKVGFYPANYFYNEDDARAEADYLVKTIQQYGFTPEKTDLPLFSDWEGFSYEWNKSEGREVTPDVVRKCTEVFCEQIKKHGYKTGVYLNRDYWDNWYGQAFFDAHPDYYIWYARPGVSAPGRDCYLWQYACDDGSEYGVSEPLDKNILFGEFIKIEPEKWAGSDKYLEVIKGNCEFFDETNVDKPLGKLQEGTLYKIKKVSVEKINGFMWAEIIFTAGDSAFVALLDDRCIVIDEPNVYAEEIKKLQEENAVLKEERDKLRDAIEEAHVIVSDKTKEISTLKSTVSMQEIMIVDLSNQIKNLDEEYKEDMAAQQKIVAELGAQIAEKDSEITALKTEIEYLKHKATALEQQLGNTYEEVNLFVSALQRFVAWLKGV